MGVADGDLFSQAERVVVAHLCAGLTVGIGSGLAAAGGQAHDHDRGQ